MLLSCSIFGMVVGYSVKLGKMEKVKLVFSNPEKPSL